jgi:dTDP-4-amino-4,6-dideoxygalactose transaminase
MIVPLVDLKLQYESIRPEIDSAIQRVVQEACFVGGNDHREFEREFAAYCESEACAAVGNGTDALYLALRALGIGNGDEVITVAHTFIATAEAITLTGALPRLPTVPRPSFPCICPASRATWTACTTLPAATSSRWWKMPRRPTVPVGAAIVSDP